MIAAAAASLIRPVDIDEPLRRAARALMNEPVRPALRVLRAGSLVAAGILLLVARDAVIALIFTVAGLYLIFLGITALLWLVYRPRAARAGDAAPRVARRRVLPAAALAVLLIAGVGSAFLASGGATTEAPASGPCNGDVELCDRALPDVALAATHNSMSVPLPGWYAAEQDVSIPQQLRDGVRGLLIDAHYADRLGNGRLRTDVENLKLVEIARQDGVSQDTIDAALRLRARAGFKGEGERGMYLCHTFCELGGTPLESALEDVHDFLAANPGEVMVIVNEDYVTPADYVGAVRSAGLERLAYKGPTAGRWPTLRRMIDTDQRVLFLAENHAGAAPWYHPAYDAILQETPYAFSKVAQLTDPALVPASCAPNRGPESAPLFLVNNWISTDPVPLPSNAAAVNAYEPLLARLRACARIRGRMPNLVAVNFERRGDVQGAVDTLNGLGRPGDR